MAQQARDSEYRLPHYSKSAIKVKQSAFISLPQVDCKTREDSTQWEQQQTLNQQQQFASLLFVYNKQSSLPTRGKFCCLLFIFANSLDPDQAQQNVGSDLDPKCLTIIG